MLRRLLGLVVAAGLVAGFAGSSTAGVFDPSQSPLIVKLGALPTITVEGSYGTIDGTGVGVIGGTAVVTNNGSAHDLSDTTGIWTTVSNAPSTTLFTAVNLLFNIQLTIQNNTGDFNVGFSAPNPVGGNGNAVIPTALSGTMCPGGCLGGVETVNGVVFLNFLDGSSAPFFLNIVGVGGVNTLPVGTTGQVINVTGGPWVTGKFRMTNITTNLVFMPGRVAPPGNPATINSVAGVTGVPFTLDATPSEKARVFTTQNGFTTKGAGGATSELATVSLSGTNNLASASAAGMVSLVTPLRIDVNVLDQGVIPGKIVKKFTFVPEPGTMLLLVSGAAGLVLLGRQRMRK